MLGAFLEIAQTEAVTSRFEALALETLAREIGCDAAFFAVKGAESAPAVLGIDAESIERAVRGGSEYERELMPVKRAALAARGVAVDTDVLGEAVVRRTRYFREVAAPVKGRHSLMAYLTWRGQPRAALMLGRARAGFSPGELERVESVLSELAAARASYGWPFANEELPAPPRTGLWSKFRPKNRVLAQVATPHGPLLVRDRDGFREMVAGEGERSLVWTRAKVTEPSRSGWPYVELLHVAAAVAKERRRALFVGSGGAVGVRQFARMYPGIAIDLVEHEPVVFELAREWYGLASIPGVTLHVADGADFVAHASRASWDVMIVDAYSDGFVERFARRSFFESVRRALTPGGALALNVIGTIDGNGVIPEVLSAARRELGEPRIVPVLDAAQPYDPHALRNVVVIVRSE